jgi:hypothetical protein
MTYPRAVIVTGKNNIKFVGLCLQNQVDFLLIGGAAAFHYGCRADGISEIDLLIEPSAENSERVMSVLKDAGVGVDFKSTDLQRSKVQVPIKNYEYNLDILTPMKEFAYSDLRCRSEFGTLGSYKVRIISRDDLIRLKEYVIQHMESETDKHRQDVICLKTKGC